MLTMLPDSRIVNVTASTGQVKVKRQHPPGPGARVENRHRPRLPRRLSSQRPGLPSGWSCRITRVPDMPSTGNQGRYRRQAAAASLAVPASGSEP